MPYMQIIWQPNCYLSATQHDHPYIKIMKEPF